MTRKNVFYKKERNLCEGVDIIKRLCYNEGKHMYDVGNEIEKGNET